MVRVPGEWTAELSGRQVIKAVFWSVFSLVISAVGSMLLQEAWGQMMGAKPESNPLQQAVLVAEEKPAVEAGADFRSRYRSLQRLPKATTLATLHNGLTVLVQENHAAPVVTVRCYSAQHRRVPSRENIWEPVSATCWSTWSPAAPQPGASEKEIERIIDSIGGATNAFTSVDVTGYYIDCPSKHVFTALELMAEFMLHCAFAPEEFDRELKVVRQEMADGEVNRRRVLWNLLNQTMYLEHPVRHPVIGYADVLMQTTNEEIIAFYRERYVPNNQLVVVVGDVDTDAILAAVSRLWGDVPRGKELFFPMPDEPLPLSPRPSVAGDGRQNVRSGSGLAHHPSGPSRPVCPGPGSLHLGRGGKLAAGTAAPE